MDTKLYDTVATEFDRLIDLHDPLASEENRQAFRKAFEQYLESMGVPEMDFEDELMNRAGWGRNTR